MKPTNIEVLAALQAAHDIADCPACEFETSPDCEACAGEGWIGMHTPRTLAIAALMRLAPQDVTDRDCVKWKMDAPVWEGNRRNVPSVWFELLCSEVESRCGRKVPNPYLDRLEESVEEEQEREAEERRLRYEPDGTDDL